jgi:tetratricopeptide (TPR) repeat protein
MSVDEAKRLHQAGQTDQAISMIEQILASDEASTDTAGALDLLGTIAVDEGYLSMAQQAWSRLLDEYPDYAAGKDVDTRLRLVSALLMAQGSESPTVETTAVEKPAVEVPATKMPAEAAPAVPAPAPLPATGNDVKSTPQPVAPAAEISGKVLVAGRGRPYDAVVETNRRIVEFLRERGVDAVSSTGDVPVVEGSDMVLPFLLRKGEDEGAGSVLLVTADYLRMQKIVTECYLPAGAELWTVKAKGGTGTKGRPYSATGVTEALLERFLDRLEKKVGGPGLPVTLQ